VDFEGLGLQRLELTAQDGRVDGIDFWHRCVPFARDRSYRQVLQLDVLVLLVLVQLLHVLVLAVLQQPARSSSPTSAYSQISNVSASSDSSSWRRSEIRVSVAMLGTLTRLHVRSYAQQLVLLVLVQLLQQLVLLVLQQPAISSSPTSA
jgi:hypothetical protein